uniref:Uncharacterized protein n=1 Tax=Lepeophtheirus salmonis TaxID=72036 RepID=A0A0K2US39_LEPSM
MMGCVLHYSPNKFILRVRH